MVGGLSAISSLPLLTEEVSTFVVKVGLYSKAVTTTSFGSASSIKSLTTVGKVKEAGAPRLTYLESSGSKLTAKSSKAKFAKALMSLSRAPDD